jgi:hypothetical protein
MESRPRSRPPHRSPGAGRPSVAAELRKFQCTPAGRGRRGAAAPRHDPLHVRSAPHRHPGTGGTCAEPGQVIEKAARRERIRTSGPCLPKTATTAAVLPEQGLSAALFPGMPRVVQYFRGLSRKPACSVRGATAACAHTVLRMRADMPGIFHVVRDDPAGCGSGRGARAALAGTTRAAHVTRRRSASPLRSRDC